MITETNDGSAHKTGDLRGKTDSPGIMEHLHAQFDADVQHAKSSSPNLSPPAQNLDGTARSGDAADVLSVSNLWSDSSATNLPKRFPEIYGTGNIWKDWQLAEKELNKPERPEPTDLTEEERKEAQRGADLVDILGRVRPKATYAEKLRAAYDLKDMFSNLSPEERQRLIDSINPLLKDKGLKLVWVPESAQLTIGGLDRKSGKYVFGPIVFGEKKPLN